MIINYLKNKFISNKKEPTEEVIYSHYYPDKFYKHKLVNIDDSLEYFIKNSIVDFPDKPLIISQIYQWTIGGDVFEEIQFNDLSYKLIYDSINDIFYLCQLEKVSRDEINLDQETINFSNNDYTSWLGAVEIEEKNQLLAIYNRTISHEADEYLFIEVNKKFTYSFYCGIIVQPTMIS